MPPPGLLRVLWPPAWRLLLGHGPPYGCDGEGGMLPPSLAAAATQMGYFIHPGWRAEPHPARSNSPTLMLRVGRTGRQSTCTRSLVPAPELRFCGAVAGLEPATYGLEVRLHLSTWYCPGTSPQVRSGSLSDLSHPGRHSYSDRIARGIASLATSHGQHPTKPTWSPHRAGSILQMTWFCEAYRGVG